MSPKSSEAVLPACTDLAKQLFRIYRRKHNANKKNFGKVTPWSEQDADLHKKFEAMADYVLKNYPDCDQQLFESEQNCLRVEQELRTARGRVVELEKQLKKLGAKDHKDVTIERLRGKLKLKGQRFQTMMLEQRLARERMDKNGGAYRRLYMTAKTRAEKTEEERDTALRSVQTMEAFCFGLKSAAEGLKEELLIARDRVARFVDACSTRKHSPIDKHSPDVTSRLQAYYDWVARVEPLLAEVAEENMARANAKLDALDNSTWPFEPVPEPAAIPNPEPPTRLVYEGCEFDRAFVGRCKKPCPGPYCAVHELLKCCVCGEQATHECDYTGQFVCGFLLCNGCGTDHTDPDFGNGMFRMEHKHVRLSPKAEEPAVAK